jgi:hypothetical protein
VRIGVRWFFLFFLCDPGGRDEKDKEGSKCCLFGSCSMGGTMFMHVYEWVIFLEVRGGEWQWDIR